MGIGRLKFKGDKPKSKKRKHSEKQDAEQELVPWPVCTVELDLKGPLFIYSTASKLPAILTSYEHERLSFRKPKSEISVMEPTNVSQVFVVRKTHPDSKVYSIKNAQDKFMGADTIGGVYCDRDAVGPSEQWEIVKVENGFAFKSHFGMYLKYDVSESVSVPARADSTQVGPEETFTVHCQADNKTLDVVKVKEEKSAAQTEFDNLKLYHSLQSSSFGEVR